MSATEPRRIALPDLLLALVMCAFVLVPLVGAGWLGSRSDVSTTEKRKLANLPPWPTSFNDWMAFSKAFDVFATDRFGFRPQLLTGYKWIVAGVFHDSISPRAFVGRKGWLFVTGSGSLDDMRGAGAYTDAELVNAVQQINARGELLAVHRIKFGFVVFPDKHTVYPEYLPHGLYAGFGQRRLNALDAAMADAGHPWYFDASGALRADARDSRFNLYYKSDTHWTAWGGYLGYRAWVAANGPRLGLKPVEYRFDQFRKARSTPGDLALMSGYRPREPELVKPPVAWGCAEGMFAWKVPATTLQRLDTAARYMQTAECVGSGRALVVHDSFMDWISPLLVDNFRHAWLARAYPNDATFGWLVDQLHPDVVIVQRVERAMANFPATDIPALVKDLGVIGQPASVDVTGRLRIGTGSNAFARPAVDVSVAMDRVERVGNQVSLAGWARMDDSSPAAIIVVARGKVVAEAPVTLHRPDVAQSQGNPKLAWSGFSVNVPLKAIGGAVDALRIYFVDFDDYGAYPMSGTFARRLRTAAEQSK
jgi:hypothetical protein